MAPEPLTEEDALEIRCPFCGGEAAIYGNDAPHMPSWLLVRVVCDGCGLSSRSFATKAEARDFWNTRLAAPSGREAGEQEALCADCGHPEDWHTGSFTACNHPHHQCRCDGFLHAPSAAREDSDGK